jgi:hypothetical protein
MDGWTWQTRNDTDNGTVSGLLQARLRLPPEHFLDGSMDLGSLNKLRPSTLDHISLCV